MKTAHPLSRRLLMRTSLAILGSACLPAFAQEGRSTILIGTTPVFLDDQVQFLKVWRDYLQAKLGYTVEFVQRGSYRAVTDLLLEGAIDCAWLCGYPYVRYRDKLQLVAVPSFKRRPLYESYMIVARERDDVHDLADMRGHSYAFSDPMSNSGYLAPRYTLWSNGIDPDKHFSRTLFTWAHKKVVQAVSVGLVDGGSVDGYVWETLALTQPEMTSSTRVAWKSPSYGFPPVVASKTTSASLVAALRNAFVGMADDANGKRLLKTLNLDGFVVAPDALFDPIARMMQELTKAGKLP